jgi:hypothetical protein
MGTLLFMLAFAYSALGEDAEAIGLLELAGMPGFVLSESRRASEMFADLTDQRIAGRWTQ